MTVKGTFEMVSKGDALASYTPIVMAPRANGIQYSCFTNSYISVHFILFSGKAFIEYLKTVQFVQ